MRKRNVKAGKEEIKIIISDKQIAFIKKRCVGLFEYRLRLRRAKVRFDTNFKEFDPGSGRTLAARLTHASRTEH